MIISIVFFPDTGADGTNVEDARGKINSQKERDQYNKLYPAFRDKSNVPDASFWKDLNQGKIDEANNYVKDQDKPADDMSTWQAHSMCQMYEDDLWDLYATAETSEESEEDTVEGKDPMQYGYYDGITKKQEAENLEFFKKCSAMDKQITFNKTILKSGISEEKKAPEIRSRRSQKEHASTSSKKGASGKKKSGGSGKAEIESNQCIDDGQKHSKGSVQENEHLPGFLKSPLGSKEKMTGRHHSKENENLQFFKYISRNPGFFRSDTPTPPSEDQAEGNSSMKSSSVKDYTIDAETAADNMFFFRTVSKSSLFYTKTPSKPKNFGKKQL